MNALFETLLTLRHMEYVTQGQYWQIVTVSPDVQRFADGAAALARATITSRN